MKRFLAWLTLEPGDRVITVLSWWPSWGRYGPEWPAMRIDDKHGQRRTVTPVWDWVRLKQLFRRRDS